MTETKKLAQGATPSVRTARPSRRATGSPTGSRGPGETSEDTTETTTEITPEPAPGPTHESTPASGTGSVAAANAEGIAGVSERLNSGGLSSPPQATLAWGRLVTEQSVALAMQSGDSTADTEIAAYLDALRAEFDTVLLPGVRARLLHGAERIPPRLLSERMLAVAPMAPRGDVLAEQVGPEYFDTNGVRAVLAAPGARPVPRRTVEQRRRDHTLLALQTSQGDWIHPTWQFRGQDVLPGLVEVLAVFYPRPESPASLGPGAVDVARPVEGSEADQNAANNRDPTALGREKVMRAATRRPPFSPWSVAVWLTTPQRDLNGLSVAEWLRENGSLDPVVELARRTAAAWVT